MFAFSVIAVVVVFVSNGKEFEYNTLMHTNIDESREEKESKLTVCFITLTVSSKFLFLDFPFSFACRRTGNYSEMYGERERKKEIRKDEKVKWISKKHFVLTLEMKQNYGKVKIMWRCVCARLCVWQRKAECSVFYCANRFIVFRFCLCLPVTMGSVRKEVKWLVWK